MSIVSADPLSCPDARSGILPIQKKRYTVLHIDEDPIFLSLSKEALERFGDVTVVTASEPDDALVKLTGEEYSLILINIRFSNLSGNEIIGVIRKSGSNAPLLLLSSSDLSAYEKERYGVPVIVVTDAEPDSFHHIYLMLVHHCFFASAKSPMVYRDILAKIPLFDSLNRHEMNNLLHAQQTILHLLIGKYQDPELLAYLHHLSRSSHRIFEIVEAIGNGRDLASAEWIRYTTILEKAVSSVYKGKIFICIEENDIEILTDPLMVRVFINLIENSILHGESVDEISISCSFVYDLLVIRYADNGVGIPASEKEKIFSEGYGSHTGLGLYLIQEILSHNMMIIRETGEYGLGAVFEIVIPRERYRIIDSS